MSGRCCMRTRTLAKLLTGLAARPAALAVFGIRVTTRCASATQFAAKLTRCGAQRRAMCSVFSARLAYDNAARKKAQKEGTGEAVRNATLQLLWLVSARRSPQAAQGRNLCWQTAAVSVLHNACAPRLRTHAFSQLQRRANSYGRAGTGTAQSRARSHRPRTPHCAWLKESGLAAQWPHERHKRQASVQIRHNHAWSALLENELPLL